MPNIASILLSCLLGWVPSPPPLQIDVVFRGLPMRSKIEPRGQAQRVNARVYFVRLDVGGERRICRLAVGR
jgi:hypothetical protein